MPDRPARSQSLHRLSYPAHAAQYQLTKEVAMSTQTDGPLIALNLKILGLARTSGFNRGDESSGDL